MTTKTWRKGLLAFGIALIVIQFLPVDRGNPPVETEMPAPTAIRAILRRSCYDCHSNETAWPWYSRVAPVSWLLANDVKEGRGELNMSAWNRYDEKRRLRKMKEINEQVTKGEMPLTMYALVHRSAALSAEDAAALREWALAQGAIRATPGGSH